MSSVIDPLYFGFGCTLAVWLALLGLRTRVRRALKRDAGGPRAPRRWSGAQTPVELSAKLGLGIIALLLVLMPVGGLPLWKWAFSFCPNPSLALLATVVAALVPRLIQVPIFAARDWRVAWLFGAVVGTVLYLQPFCFPGFDLYYWGSHPRIVAWVLAGAAVVFLGFGARFGVVLLLALAAYAFRLLESDNGWEYTVDPFYWMISVGVVATSTARAILRRTRPAAADQVA